jgi:hypothetical protein
MFHNLKESIFYKIVSINTIGQERVKLIIRTSKYSGRNKASFYKITYIIDIR